MGDRSQVRDLTDLSESAQNYLKVMWSLQEWSDEPVTASLLASRLEVRTSTVSDAIRRLADRGLVDHTPYRSIRLTEDGRALALAMVRRHRLIETFLVQVLGYEWDEVHDEAERLEHAMSDTFVERIDAHLGHPTRDPHGDPIPSVDGGVPQSDASPLTGIEVGRRVRIERISDADPQLLQFFAEHDLRIGAVLEIRQDAPFTGSVQVDVEGRAEPAMLGRAATDAVWVTPIDR